MSIFGNGVADRDYRMDGYISEETVTGEKYQAELKKLQKHYGYRATLDSHYQAEWDKEGAYQRQKPEYDLWQRIEAEKDIIAADFATEIHVLLAEGKTAEEIIEKLGSFEDYLRELLDDPMRNLLSEAKVTSILKRTKRKWWFEY